MTSNLKIASRTRIQGISGVQGYLSFLVTSWTITSFAQPKAGSTTPSGPGKMQDPTTDFRDFPILPQLAWKFAATQPFFATPVIDEDKVYIGNNDSLLYCLDLRSGTVIWKFNTSGPLRSGVALDKDRLFLIGGDSGFYCLDKNTGRTNWTFRTEGERYYDQYDYYQSTPVLKGDTVFFGSGPAP